MRVAVLGGAGAMGRVTVRDLAESHEVDEVLLADAHLPAAQYWAEKIGSRKIAVQKADVSDHDGLVALLRGWDVVVNCVPFALNVQVMEAALAAGVHYVDLGGLFYMTRKQVPLHDRFKAAGLIAVIGMGATPGITNVMARHAANQLHTMERLDIRCGCADETQTTAPLVAPYSLPTILDEFTVNPVVFRDGEFAEVAPLSGVEVMDFPAPVNRVQANYSLHSEIATFPDSFKDLGLRQTDFKIAFPPDFLQKLKLLTDLGLGSATPIAVNGAAVEPRAVLNTLLNAFVEPSTEVADWDMLRVEAFGTDPDGRSRRILLESISAPKPEWNVGGGAYDTGVPPSIAAQMIARGQITERGVLAPENCVPSEIFFSELRQRGIEVVQTTSVPVG